MRPGKFFEKWFHHPNTFSGRNSMFGDEQCRMAFDKGREYEKKYGKGTWKSKSEALRYLVRKKK